MRTTCSSPFRPTPTIPARRRASPIRTADLFWWGGEPVQRDSRGGEGLAPWARDLWGRQEQPAAPYRSAPGIQSGQAACSYAPVTACISTRRRSEWSLRTCRRCFPITIRSARISSSATHRSRLPAQRHGHRALRGPHACRARNQRAVRGAPVAALEHRRAAAPVLPRRDRCGLRRFPWRSPDSVREHQPAATSRSEPGTADRRTWCAHSRLRRDFDARDDGEEPLPWLRGQFPSRGWPCGVGDRELHVQSKQGGRDLRQRRDRRPAESARQGRRVCRRRAPTGPTSSRRSTCTNCRLPGERQRAGGGPCWEGGRSPGSPESNPARPLECRSSIAITTTGVSRRHCGPTRSAIRRPGTRPACSGWTPRRLSRRPAGEYGAAPVAPFRLPGRHQWDFSVSKNVSLGGTRRLQFRADLINAFNQTQFLDVDTSVFRHDDVRPPCSDSAR